MSRFNWHYNTGIEVAGLSTSEMLQKADLDWDVEASPIYFGDFGQYQIPGQKAIFRADNKQFIDFYSARKIASNVEIVGFFEKLLKLADLEIETLGHLDSKHIYCTARLKEYDMDVRKVGDITESRIMLYDSHSNNQGFQVFNHYNRLVCTNGMTERVKQKISINHVGGINRNSARIMLAKAIEQAKSKSVVSEFLAEKTMRIEEAQLQLITAFGDPEKSVDEQSPMVKTCLRLFQGEAQGGELLSAYNTAYGLLQSVTEYYSHNSKAQTETSRFQSILNGEYAKKANQFERQLVTAYR